MSNILSIDGRKTKIILPSVEVPVSLNAEYKGMNFDFSKISGIYDGDKPLLLLHFSRGDRKYKPNQLNHVIVLTVGYDKPDLQCRALGISKYPSSNSQLEFFRMGDDLETNVTPSALEAMLTLPRELKRAMRTSELETLSVHEMCQMFPRMNLN